MLVSNNLNPYISPRLLNHKPQEPTWLGTEILKLGETPTNMRRMNPNPKTSTLRPSTEAFAGADEKGPLKKKNLRPPPPPTYREI